MNNYLGDRQSIRLKGYNYAEAGIYFVTLCSYCSRDIFSQINKDSAEVKLSKIGEYIDQCWQEISDHYPNVYPDTYVVMPNHFHGIIQILGRIEGAQYIEPVSEGAQNIEPVRRIEPVPRQNEFQKMIPGSLGAIIRGFKIGVSKLSRQNLGIEKVWHRNYHERIVKDIESLKRIRKYIKENPRNYC